MIGDINDLIVDEEIVLEKFDGEPHPDHLVERVHLHNGKIVKHEFIEGGLVVRTVEGGGN